MAHVLDPLIIETVWQEPQALFPVSRELSNTGIFLIWKLAPELQKNFSLCRDGMQGVVKLHVGLHKYYSTHCSPTCRHGAPWIAGSHLPACWIFAPGTLLHRHNTVVYNNQTYYRITGLYFIMNGLMPEVMADSKRKEEDFSQTSWLW